MNEEIHLNPTQHDAVTTIYGPALVIAGAGSGKTRVVTSRIVYLIENGIPPHSILAVTFTNKAAAEMRERVYAMTQHRILICTFHSLGVRILREAIDALGYHRNFTIYDEEDVEKLLKNCLLELNIKKENTSTFRRLISQAKNALQDPNELLPHVEDNPLLQELPKVYSLYQHKLKEYQAVDFDDLLFLTVKLWHERPDILLYYQERWQYILIDEYQDTNHVQYTLTRLLASVRQNLFVVGDPDQSIYSWRGANIENILNFERDYPGAKVIRLEQNYRSSTNILQVANALISYNEGRYEKQLWSKLGPGSKIKLFIGDDERQEAQFIASEINHFSTQQQVALNDIVVFYRTNAQSRILEDSLLHHNLSYTIVGGISFYQRKEIKDILAFLRISQSTTDYISFTRTINLPKRGLGEATIEKIRQNAYQESLSILSYCQGIIEEKSFTSKLRISKKQRESLTEYLTIIQDLKESSKDGIRKAVVSAIERTGYLSHLLEDKETYEERRQNLTELVAKAAEWEEITPDSSLEAFLTELSLKSSLDESKQNNERVTLMTIHNGKGLEYRVAFLIGLEEDLFPHIHSKNNQEQVEEERRLCYVGITRAKESLYLSYCRTRYLWNHVAIRQPSRFLHEIPSEYIEKVAPIPRKYFFNEYPKQEMGLEKEIFQKQSFFQVGDRIKHTQFGFGEINEIYEGSMGLTYKISFDSEQTTKSFLAKYANFSKA
jgi:DNA helicase-2/ATP-dependent DNA helicase PcrA